MYLLPSAGEANVVKAGLMGLLAMFVLMANAACGDVADKIAPSMVRIQFKDISKSGGTGFPC